MAVLGGLGMLYSSDFYQRNIGAAEKDNLVSLLWRARSRALNNVNQSNQGVEIGTSTYTVFEGSSYAARNAALDETFPKASGMNLGGLSEVVFASPDGAVAASGTISVGNALKNYSITINAEGAIDWQ